MKLTIKIEKEVSIEVSKGTKLLEHKDGWITWYRINGDVVKLYTCEEDNFESQDDTREIELWKDEIRNLAKIIQ